ncbi:hypothetical protein C1J01_44070 [Nonomuraea aridisoli]|uniref:ATP-grasp domain-containing protein n=2 Tax=Nonomuraea aridisoli TaxID=2070368 RepID=A0A2W2DYH7_9ACTN|nr:hypothetical protein C1J01_44070 [Nonomuraea aridisoli]
MTDLAQMSAIVDQAREGLAAALAGRPLVTVERLTSALRTSYTGPAAIEELRPTLSIGCYRAWPAAMPRTAAAAEDHTLIRSTQERHDWLPRMRRDADRHLRTLNRPIVTAWYATPLLRDLAAASGTVAATDGELRDTIEAKPAFNDLLRAAGVPATVRIPSVRVDRLPDLAELRRAVGTNTVVVQSGATSGGRGTVFVTSERDLDDAARLRGPYRVAAFVDGWSSNTTVLSVPDGQGGVSVYVDRPSHKSVGVAELGIGPAKSAGNDWSRPWPTGAATVLVECAERITEWAWRRHRAAGLFGLDAILTAEGHVYPNEINWRNQARPRCPPSTSSVAACRRSSPPTWP